MSATRKKALFNPQSVPPGGVCLSCFVLVRNGGRVLVGKMDKPEIWIERFFVGEKFAPAYHSSGKYMLPARHLAWYESPLGAAEGVLREQLKLRIPSRGLRLMEVQSHVRGEPDSAERPAHWDICFLYEVKVGRSVAQNLPSPPWFSDLRFVPLSSLSVRDFTRDHGDILQEAGLVKGG